VGNFFGFAWNLAVSMCFQFVGFLLTYLLHTTHAAKCGSRAGLGITLIQYGFYLHSRAADGLGNVQNQAAGTDYASDPDTIGNGPLNAAALLFGESANGPQGGGTPAVAASVGTGWWGTHTSRRFLFTARDWSAETFAAQGNPDPNSDSPFYVGDDANASALATAALSSTEWFAYFLIMLGSFMLFTSMFQYWRVVRWGRGLVESARRREREERAANEAATGAAATGGAATSTTDASGGADISAPVGFLSRLRHVWAEAAERARARGVISSPPSSGSGGNGQRSGEDWIVFPGMSAASRRARREAAGQDPNSGNSGGSGRTENVGDGLWWTSIAPGRRLGGGGDERTRSATAGRREASEDDDDDDEGFGILGPHSIASDGHYSPEERRFLSSLRESGFLE